VKNEFTFSCSFFARLCVSDPWFVSFMLYGEWLTLDGAWWAMISSSHGPFIMV
jgi:hypothetical protein